MSSPCPASGMPPVVTSWLRTMTSTEESKFTADCDWPNYSRTDYENLVTTSKLHKVVLGVGDDIFSSMISSVSETQSELLIVTCFWAKSKSLNRLNDALRNLSDRVVRSDGRKIRVCIGFSSCSLLQKLLHTSRHEGQLYSPKEWKRTLGLPAPEELSGLDMTVKSIFFLPFSVLHPKFIIIDRKKVWLPSCNVSWENWLEGAIEMSGDIVHRFLQFHTAVWSNGTCLTPMRETSGPDAIMVVKQRLPPAIGAAFVEFPVECEQDTISVFLPSPHHRNPWWQIFQKQEDVQFYDTPLNTFLSTLFQHSRTSIYIQTPNITSPPVLAALMRALKRGVDIHIVTGESMMVVEQIATAGPRGTTKNRLKGFTSEYNEYINFWTAQCHDQEAGGLRKPGKLRIEFFRPKLGTSKENHELEPVQSHLKLTIVDEEWIVLGSGNMDRASWFTSQELGVAFHSPALVTAFQQHLRGLLQGRTKLFYPLENRPRKHQGLWHPLNWYPKWRWGSHSWRPMAQDGSET